MKELQVRIITPLDSTAVKSVSSAHFPGEAGRLTVEANHQSMICSLAEGTTILKQPGKEERWETGKGVLKVSRNEITLLVHHATVA